MSPLPRKLLLSALLSALLANAAAAQQAPVTAAARDETIPKVEIKSSAAAYDARRDDTAAKIVVTQDEILKNGDTTIGEVLKRLPGITIGGVQGRGGEIRMRGLGSGYTQILLNGEPSPPGFSLDALAPDMVERIEIMRAATAEYTTQAIAGTINIVLKRAIVTAQRELKAGIQSDNGAPGTNINFQVSDKHGVYSYAVGGGVTYGKQDRPASGLTTFTGPDGGEALHRDVAKTNNGTFRALNLAPRLNINFGTGDVVTSQSFVTASRYSGGATERTVAQFGAPPVFSNLDLDVGQSMEMLRTDLAWSHKMAQGAKLEVKAGINYNHRDTDAPSRNADAAGTLLLDRRITSSAREKGVTASGKYATPIVEGHALTAGWDGQYSKRGEDRIQRESSPVGYPAVDLDQAYDADVGRIALFAQDEWSITKPWSVYMGLRWEGIRNRSAGRDYAPVENTSSVWSPLFQTLYKMPGSKNDQVRAGLTRTYKAPSVANLIPRRFTALNNTATTPDSQGNPNLKPELAWGLDLAYERYMEGGGLLSASTYVRRIDDVTQTRTSFIDGLWVAMPTNAGVANTRGVELEAKFPLRLVYKTGPAIDMRANVSRNWSRLDAVPGPDNRLDSQTPISANFGLDYKADKLPLTLGASFNYQDGGPVRITVNQFAYTAPKRTLDTYALVKFTPKTQLRISVANLLHQQNRAATTYADQAGALTDVVETPTSVVFRALLEMKL